MNNINKKYLVLGSTGMLGKQVLKELKSNNCDVVTISRNNSDYNIDVSNFALLENIVDTIKPDIIINCIGVIDVKKCEDDFEYALNINARINYVFQKLSSDNNFKYVYISTDNYFDNGVGHLNSEIDDVTFFNNYAKSKFEGEKICENINNSLVVRTNITGFRGCINVDTFIEWVFNTLYNREKLNLFNDYYTSTIDVETFTKYLLWSIDNDLNGVFNIASRDACSKMEFILNVAKKIGIQNLNYDVCSVDNLPIKRAKNCGLDVSKFEKIYGENLPKIDDVINNLIQQKNDIISSKKYNYGKQYIDTNDKQNVLNVLDDDFLTCGPMVEKFEDKIKNICNVKYAISCSNGTAALHLASIALGIGDGDIVIVPSSTFVATANAVKYCGGDVVFCDVDGNTGLATPKTIQNAINSINDKSKLKAIFVVSLCGQSCDMKEIKKIADKYNVKLLEDNAHSIGSSYQDEMVGSCKWSDISIFSFHPVKTVCMGEGGAITTNDDELAEAVKYLRTHGIYKDNITCEENSSKGWYYEQRLLGYNYRVSDINCALGLGQLDKLSKFKEKRAQIIQWYKEEVLNIDNVKLFNVLDDRKSCFHLCVLKFDFDKIGMSKEKIFSELKKCNIFTQSHYMPINFHPYHLSKNSIKENFKGAWDWYDNSLSFPIYYSLERQDVVEICKRLKTVLKAEV